MFRSPFLSDEEFEAVYRELGRIVESYLVRQSKAQLDLKEAVSMVYSTSSIELQLRLTLSVAASAYPLRCRGAKGAMIADGRTRRAAREIRRAFILA